MKCIVLGAGGQLGREWMYQLKEHTGTLFNQFRGFGSTKVDLTDQNAVAEVLNSENPEVLINCAAYTRVDEAEEQKEQAERVNSTAVKFLAEQCTERQIKLVHYSTDYVFPGYIEDRRHFPQGYPEEHPTDPINWYGATKLKGEEAIRGSGAAHLILRVAWLCGPFGSNFVTTMLRLAEQNDELQVVNDQWGSPTFTGSVVKNSLALLQAGKVGTFHITSQGILTWYELARTIFEIENIDVNVKAVTSDHFPTTAKRPSFSKLSTQKIETVPGVTIPNWKAGLKQLLERL